MAKVFIDAGLEFLMGHLRYGHYEGVAEIPDEDIEKFKEDPIKYISDEYLTDYLEIIVDDVEIDGHGDITDVDYKFLED